MQRIKLKQVALKLRISSNDIVEILKHHGCVIDNSATTVLTAKHLKLLAEDYIDAVSNRLKAVNASVKKTDQDEKFLINFSSFISYDELPDGGQRAILDFQRLLRVFLDHISVPFTKTFEHSTRFFKRYLEISIGKFKVYKVCSDLKSLLISILTPRLFYVYTEEESALKAITALSFSTVTPNRFREACLNIFYSKTSILNEKYAYIN